MPKLLTTGCLALPPQHIALLALQVDANIIWIEKSFATTALLMDYLNGDFLRASNLSGSFSKKSHTRRIYYTNPEGYKNITIMSAYQTQTIVLRMGNAPNTLYPIPFVTVPLANIAPTATDLLQGLDVQAIYIDTTLVAPGTWSRTGNTLLLPPDTYADKYITIVAQQTAPAKNKTTTPALQASIIGNEVYFYFSGEAGALYELRKSTTPSADDAIALYPANNINSYHYHYTGTATEYFFLYAYAPAKEVSNPQTYTLNPDYWTYNN